MGLISNFLAVLFGSNRNILRETAEIFVENAETGAQRGAQMQGQAMQQFGAEFVLPRQGGFDRFMDGVNRLPRPALALGTLGLFVAAMVDPLWFASRMQGVALVPEPLWWLLGVIVSFYFGARHQIKAQGFQRDLAETMARVPQVMQNLNELAEMDAENAAEMPGVADPGVDAALAVSVVRAEDNPALEDWLKLRRP